MIPEHLRGSLADRLCRLGAAALYYLHQIHGASPDELKTAKWEAIKAIRQAANDLELRVADRTELAEAGLAVDVDEAGIYFAALVQMERVATTAIDYARGHQGGNEATLLEWAPESAHTAARKLAERLQDDADADDREAAEDRT